MQRRRLIWFLRAKVGAVWRLKMPLVEPHRLCDGPMSKDIASADLVVTGIPFDQAVTHRLCTRFGPRAIREASTLQPYDPPYGWDGFDPLSEFEIVDYANVAGVPDFGAELYILIGRQNPKTDHCCWLFM